MDKTDINEFLFQLVDVFEEADPSTIIPEADFRELEGYSSLTALSLIAMVDEKYNVKIKGEDIRNSKTITDLFKVIISRIKS